MSIVRGWAGLFGPCGEKERAGDGEEVGAGMWMVAAASNEPLRLGNDLASGRAQSDSGDSGENGSCRT